MVWNHDYRNLNRFNRLRWVKKGVSPFCLPEYAKGLNTARAFTGRSCGERIHTADSRNSQTRGTRSQIQSIVKRQKSNGFVVLS